MAADQLTSAIMCVPIFKRLSTTQISNLARAAERIMFRQGQIIIQADEPGDAAYLIVGGDAVVMDGETLPVDLAGLPEGTFIGEIAMLTEINYSTTVLARSDVRAMKFSRAMIRELMSDDPELAAHFVETLRLRLMGLAQKLRDIDRELSSEVDTPPISGSQQNT